MIPTDPNTKILAIEPVERTLTKPDGEVVVLYSVSTEVFAPAYKPKGARPWTPPRPVTFKVTSKVWSDAHWLHSAMERFFEAVAA